MARRPEGSQPSEDGADPESEPAPGPHGFEGVVEAQIEVALTQVDGDAARTGQDRLAVEEPLEVRVEGRSLLVTMRTPGQDLDLARSVLFTEGLVELPGDVAAVSHCREVPPEARGNVVTVTLRKGASIDESRAGRTGVMSASCGICGKTTLESIAVSSARVGAGPRLNRSLLRSLPGALRAGQAVFAATGGLHAAGLFNSDGGLLVQAEDIGRHNAVDKVIGAAMRFGRLPLVDTILMVSGRAGFEIVQKARRAGIPVVASVSAPSNLAVELAREGGQTLIGFLREERFNVYTGADRFDDL